MSNLSLIEFGRYSRTDGTEFTTHYRVWGLPADNFCVIGFAGKDKWKNSWFDNMNSVPKAVFPLDLCYDTPEKALAAVQNRLDESN